MVARMVGLMLAVGLTAGCVAVWGQSYNVALSNSRSVVIEYDPAVVNMVALLRTAQAECDKNRRDAVLDSSTRGNLGIIVNTYRCEDR